MPSKRHYYDSSSSESSLHLSSSRRRLPSPPPTGILRKTGRHVTLVDPETMSKRVDRIADNLDDTSRNLKSVDTKLSDYNSLHDDSMSALTKLQEDLEGSLHQLRNSRGKRLRDSHTLHRSELHPRRSASMTRTGRNISTSHNYDNDYATGATCPRPSSSLGISRHSRGDGFSALVHDKVHDLSTNQARLEQDLSDEISRRLKSERSTREDGRGSTSIDRVERRLKEIERGMVAERNNATQLASDVANDLLRRSQSKLQEDDMVNRSRYLQMEANKRSVENELESTRRRLEQSEGGRDALMSQIGELRALINRSDKERVELQRKVDQQQLQHKVQMERDTEHSDRLAASKRQDIEKLRQESEIEELRAALKRSTGVVQLDEMRRDLEKSERQRQQLSDHIEVLTKDLEKKEQSQSRVLNQHHDLQRDFDESERERERLCGQLEDALRKLKDLSRDMDKCNMDLRRTEQAKHDSENEKEELRSTAQDTIRQWKSKCRKQEKEIERMQENIDQLAAKSEGILKESIAGKTQANNAFQQIDKLRKEMDDLIAKRVEMDEKLRRRDAEIEEITDEKKVLMKQLKEAVHSSENIEVKLRNTIDKLSASNQKLAATDKDLESMKSMFEIAKKQSSDLQQDIRELKVQNSDLVSRIGSESQERMEAEKSDKESSNQLQAMKMELNAVHKQLQIERDTHKKELKDLHSEIHAGEVQKMDAVQRVSLKADEERTFLEREIHRVNMESNEVKAAARESQKLLLKAKEELNLFDQETKRLESEVKMWKEKFHMVKSTYESKCSEATEKGMRGQQLEDDLLWSRDRVRRLEQVIESANELLSQDLSQLEAILDINTIDSPTRFTVSDSLDKSSSKADAWLVKLRKQLEAIKKQVKTQLSFGKKAVEELFEEKEKMKEIYRNIEDDRRQLMTEVTEQNKMVDSLSREKTSLLLENKEARMIVHDLEDRVTNLTADLETSKTKSQNTLTQAGRKAFTRSKLASTSKKHNTTLPKSKGKYRETSPEADRNMPTMPKESRKEREKIQQRYAKYKDTMDSLQAELEESRSRSRQREPIRLSSGRSPSPIKKVTIANASPTIHGYSPIRPCSSSPKVVPERER